MTTYSAILLASLVLLIAFGVEHLGRWLKVPAVILLIAIGLIGKPLLLSFGWTLVGLERVVPIIGTIGLVLIVLEGALDISLSRQRLQAAGHAFAMAGVGFFACLVLLAPLISLAFSLDLFQATLVAVPFAVISSAVAIPSSQFLPARGREFVVYESSLSDIVGVLFFFALLHADGSVLAALQSLVGGGFVSLLLSAICASGLALILMRLEGQIRYIPLLAGLMGLYAAGEQLHLAPLIMVLLFGLTINNPQLIVRIPLFRHWMKDEYEATLAEFKSLALELTFAVRGFFFILLGYWTDLGNLVAPQAWLAALVVLAVIYLSRHGLLKLAGAESAPALTWIAPRGLITVLLYLSARKAIDLPDYLGGTVLIVVIFSALLVMVGQRVHDRESAPAAEAAPEPAPDSTPGH